jgi:hypothetical protein
VKLRLALAVLAAVLTLTLGFCCWLADRINYDEDDD